MHSQTYPEPTDHWFFSNLSFGMHVTECELMSAGSETIYLFHYFAMHSLIFYGPKTNASPHHCSVTNILLTNHLKVFTEDVVQGQNDKYPGPPQMLWSHRWEPPGQEYNPSPARQCHSTSLQNKTHTQTLKSQEVHQPRHDRPSHSMTVSEVHFFSMPRIQHYCRPQSSVHNSEDKSSQQTQPHQQASGHHCHSINLLHLLYNTHSIFKPQIIYNL